MLKKRIENLGEYFNGMEITNGMCIVSVHFKEKWGVYPSADDRIKVTPSDEELNVFFYYGDYESVSFDEIFDHIENTINANLEAATKFTLFQEKVEELKSLFANTELSKLQTMYYAFKEEKKTPKRRRKSTKKEAVVSVDESVLQIQPKIGEDSIAV